MGERKSVNKYYPPDFDSAKVPRARKPKNLQMKVRNMLSMTIRCKTCGNYIGKGTKFNSRKEEIVGEKYLDQIPTFRFYIKCTKCSAEITIKTDPENSDYIVESGATRNFEPWRSGDDEENQNRKRKAREEFGDPMKSLENRTFDSKREMVRDAALLELQCLKKEQATVSVDTVLAAMKRAKEEKERKQQEEDEAQIRLCFPMHCIRRIDEEEEDFSNCKKQKLGQGLTSGNPTDNVMIKAAADDDDAKPLGRKTGESSNGRKLTLGSSTVIISAKKKNTGKGKEAEVAYANTGLSLIEEYGGDSEDED